jgi:hypothetical protein
MCPETLATDELKTEEVEATLRAADTLCKVAWAKPLLTQTGRILQKLRVGLKDKTTYAADKISAGDRGFLFEIRYAAALATSGLTARYEYSAGVDGTTVDFRVDRDPPWLVELISLRASQAVTDASWTDGEYFGTCLQTSKSDSKQSEEGEMIKAQERIAAKVWNGKTLRPTKFPAPNGAVHLLMVDARGYLGDGTHCFFDYHQMTRGAEHLKDPHVAMWTDPQTNQKAPIKGLFERSCPLGASATMIERVHVIGFVCERTFAPGEISKESHFCCNPSLVDGQETLVNAILRWPLYQRPTSF